MSVLEANASRKLTTTEFHNLPYDYKQLARRPILIRGEIIEKGRMSLQNACAIELLYDAFKSLLDLDYRVRIQLPLDVEPYSDPRPDIAILNGQIRDDVDRHPSTALLVVEVSDQTLQMDLGVKAELYAAAGVPDYWVLDLAKRQLHVLRDPAPPPA